MCVYISIHHCRMAEHLQSISSEMESEFVYVVHILLRADTLTKDDYLLTIN